LEVYSNNGERIIDPDYKLAETLPSSSTARPDPDYLIDINGIVKMPLVGEIKLEGLIIRDAEAILQKEYEKYYTKPYVVLKSSSNRVIVLGAPGGKVIPLIHENMELVEILALAEGIENDGRASNIRVIRDEQVFLIDFNTIEGYKKGNMIMEPGDIVYVEPIRRPFSEALRDYGAIVSIIVSLSTLIVVINNSK
jgi:polysaccharide export outer membrane protein